MATTLIVGIDTGGTFTDLVAIAGRRLRVHKVLSTPDDPARAVIAGLKAIVQEGSGGSGRVPLPNLVTYSSTVATNALLEGKGGRVLLVTNAGFEDVVKPVDVEEFEQRIDRCRQRRCVNERSNLDTPERGNVTLWPSRVPWRSRLRPHGASERRSDERDIRRCRADRC